MFFLPLLSDAIHVDYVVCLSHCNLRGVRREGQACDLVVLLPQLIETRRRRRTMQLHLPNHIPSIAFTHAYIWIGWLCGKFVSSLPLIIVQQYRAVNCAHGQLLVVRRPRDGSHPRGSLLQGNLSIYCTPNVSFKGLEDRCYSCGTARYLRTENTLQVFQVHFETPRLRLLRLHARRVTETFVFFRQLLSNHSQLGMMGVGLHGRGATYVRTCVPLRAKKAPGLSPL